MKSKTKTIKKVLGLALSLSICASFIPSALTANAEESDYTITIPATLDVANSGWNAIGDISATGTLASGKKLTVTAESANNWALVSGQNSVSYTLCNSTMSLEKGDAATSWDFTELNNEPNRKFIGIDVADYSEKPAGTYQDTVTFTAIVEDDVPTLATAFKNGAIIVINFKYQGGAHSATLTNDNGIFKYTAGSGYLWDYQHSLNYQDMVIARNEDSKLVVRAADMFSSGYNGNDKNYDMMLKMVFDPATNIYEQSVSRASWDTYISDAERLNEYAFTSITINGTDITSTLTKGSQTVVVN